MEKPKYRLDRDDDDGVREDWNSFARNYHETMQTTSVQGGIVLYSQTRAKFGKKILDAGSGAGLGARLFILGYMQPGTVYYTGDIAPEMVKISHEMFLKSELGKCDTISYTVLDEAPMHEVEDYKKDDLTKRIFATVANNEKLPYPDGSFDRYISNLSMMIVDNPLNQMKEAFRVLENGGIAGFSVFGREEMSRFFILLPESVKALGYEMPKLTRSYFHNNDRDKMKEDLESVGFKEVKTFYSPANYALNCHECFQYTTSLGPYAAEMKALPDIDMVALEEEFTRRFNELFGPDTIYPVEFELLIAIAKKPE